jgi:hypothetical protein
MNQHWSKPYLNRYIREMGWEVYPEIAPTLHDMIWSDWMGKPLTPSKKRIPTKKQLVSMLTKSVEWKEHIECCANLIAEEFIEAHKAVLETVANDQ